jgi:hypothetical protein
MFHCFRPAKFACVDSIFSLGQFLLLPRRRQKTMLAIKVVKIDSKIIRLLPRSKSVKQPVELPKLFQSSDKVKINV